MNQMVLTTNTLTKVSDALELLIQKGEGRLYVEDMSDIPFLSKPVKPVSQYTHHFTAKYTRNVLTITADCMVMVLTDGRIAVSTLTAPSTTIRHSSTNVLKSVGTAFNVPTNVKELYRITTTYQITKVTDKAATGIFKDTASWAMRINDYRGYVTELVSASDYQVTNTGRVIDRLI